MALLPSGSREDVELLKIEAAECSLIIKGKPYHERYESLKQYRTINQDDVMTFSVKGERVEEYEVFDVRTGEMTSNSDSLRPIFFENAFYTVVVVPKVEKELSFYHEHPLLRQAVSPHQTGNQTILFGSLQFQNEVGYTTFEIRADREAIIEVMIEIFPVKLDYQRDYRRLLEEVNDEIYNLAFHFIRKTFLGAKLKLDGRPSRAEFYRLLSKHFQAFLRAVERIEQQPHHKLETIHENARGDQLRKQDARSRSYLRKHGEFIEVNEGIALGSKRVMPLKGLRLRKELTFDTLENRYVKWMIGRLIHKLTDLEGALLRESSRWKEKPDEDLLSRITGMKKQLEGKLKQPFWKRIGPLKQSVMSLVLQMAPGYRDAFQIYLTVSKGLMLEGNIYQMSVKDVAQLYEYWTFLKMGQILNRKYKLLSQDIVKVNRDGLYVRLDGKSSVRRVFQHPVTKEEIILTYQKQEQQLPTVNQVPDTVLSIQKNGKDYPFHYIFDAKYRIDYAQKGSYYQSRYKTPGPMEDDINTMHRYRDSIVAANEGPYERIAFGAYVLFPWDLEEEYEEHHFYKSINQVNIGGLPFLPNATTLVERFVERLIDKSPEEIQREGILPKGSYEEWRSSLDKKVLVGLVQDMGDYRRFLQERCFKISNANLKKGWQEAEYIALYVKNGVGAEKGVREFAKIREVKWKDGQVYFEVEPWRNLPSTIKPVNYGIASYMMTTLTLLKEARELPELFMKSQEELTLWKILRRISGNIQMELDEANVDEATGVQAYRLKDLSIQRAGGMLTYSVRGRSGEISLELLRKYPSAVFRRIVNELAKI